MAKKTAEVTVSVDTEADLYWVALDDRELKFGDDKAKARVPLEEKLLLGWWVRGAPGSDIKIDVEAEDGYEVKGKFPIQTEIPASVSKAGGFRVFTVVKEEEEG